MHGPINIRCVFSSTAIQISFVFCNIKKVYCNIFSFRDFLTTRQPWLVLASSSLGFQDNTQTRRNLWVSPRRVICPPPRPVPDKTHTHTHKTLTRDRYPCPQPDSNPQFQQTHVREPAVTGVDLLPCRYVEMCNDVTVDNRAHVDTAFLLKMRL